MSPRRARLVKSLINPIYMGILAMINMGFSVVLLQSFGNIEFKMAHETGLLTLCLIVNGIFLIDMIVNFIVLKPKNVWAEKKFLYLELIF